MRRNKADADATLQLLIRTARARFTELGYAGTTLDAVAGEAKVTRGAVYHHFRDKKELFRCVLETVQAEVAERVEGEASAGGDLWEQLAFGCRAFVLAAMEPDSKRIMLIDGPSIMGWEEWRAMDARHSMRLLRGQLELMRGAGMFAQVSLDAATHYLSGALNETALWLAHQSERNEAADEALLVIDRFMAGLKRQEERS